VHGEGTVIGLAVVYGIRLWTDATRRCSWRKTQECSETSSALC
jgi:hypothetical protein